MVYTLEKLITELKKLAERTDADPANAAVVVIDEKKMEQEQQEKSRVYGHHPVVGVVRHGNTIMLIFRS